MVVAADCRNTAILISLLRNLNFTEQQIEGFITSVSKKMPSITKYHLLFLLKGGTQDDWLEICRVLQLNFGKHWIMEE